MWIVNNKKLTARYRIIAERSILFKHQNFRVCVFRENIFIFIIFRQSKNSKTIQINEIFSNIKKKEIKSLPLLSKIKIQN